MNTKKHSPIIMFGLAFFVIILLIGLIGEFYNNPSEGLANTMNIVIPLVIVFVFVLVIKFTKKRFKDNIQRQAQLDTNVRMNVWKASIWGSVGSVTLLVIALIPAFWAALLMALGANGTSLLFALVLLIPFIVSVLAVVATLLRSLNLLKFYIIEIVGILIFPFLFIRYSQLNIFSVGGLLLLVLLVPLIILIIACRRMLVRERN